MTSGYGSLGTYIAMVFKSPSAVAMLTRRLCNMVSCPEAVWASLAGARGCCCHGHDGISGLFGIFQFLALCLDEPNLEI